MEKIHISNNENVLNTSPVKTGVKNVRENCFKGNEFGSDLNLHISDDSNHHSENYEYIEYDPDNALDFDSSDKEHSGDDSESTEQIEGISSYEEMTSQDELDEGRQHIVDEKLAAIMNIDSHLSKDSDSSSRVVADVIYNNTGNNLIQNWQKPLFKAAKRIQFNDESDVRSDYECINTSNTFESQLEKAKEKQNCIEDKMKRLLKSLMILNVRNMAKHMGKEVATLHEYIYDLHNSKYRHNSDYSGDYYIQNFHDYSSMLTEIKNHNTSQENTFSRNKYQNKYFGAGSSVNPKCIAQPLLPSLDPKDAKNISDSCTQFNTQLHLLETTLDSEATESSSSDESICDDYNNEHQRQLPLSKRVSTQIKKLENSYASRMRWIQLHLTYLEIQKKYHDYIHSVLQTMKSNLRFIDETNESVSANTITNVPEDKCFSCARIRPLDVKKFKKRKLLQTQNLHAISKIAAQTTSIKCGCQWPFQPCAMCTGRADPTAPRLPNDCLDLKNRLALLDPGLHPNLSVLSEVHQNIHFNAIMKMPEWQAKMIRCGPRIKTLLAATTAADRRLLKEELKHDRPRKFIKKSNVTSTVVKSIKTGYKKRGRKPSSSKLPKRRKLPDYDDNCDSSLSTNISEESQNVSTSWSRETSRAERQTQRSTSFDIDNMVIPYGVPVTTKVQVLPYKEIITPKWRVVNFEPLSESVSEDKVRTCSNSLESDEDISDENCFKRHMRCLLEERKKFGVYTKLSWTTRSRANRRLESKTMDIMPVTPQSEHTSESELPLTTESPDNTEINADAMTDIMKRSTNHLLGNDSDIISDVNEQPFTPRQFPLTEDDYESMIAVMPAKHTEILNLMQSCDGDDLILRQSLTESEHLDMDLTSPFNEVIIQQKEGNVDTGVLDQFVMTNSDESVTLDDPDDPEWG